MNLSDKVHKNHIVIAVIVFIIIILVAIISFHAGMKYQTMHSRFGRGMMYRSQMMYRRPLQFSRMHGQFGQMMLRPPIVNRPSTSSANPTK